MNNQNTEFVMLNASTGEKFFRRSAVSFFGYNEKTYTTSHTDREVRVVYQTSGATARALTYTVTERKDFEQFRDALLNLPEPHAAPAGDVALRDRLPDDI